MWPATGSTGSCSPAEPLGRAGVEQHARARPAQPRRRRRAPASRRDAPRSPRARARARRVDSPRPDATHAASPPSSTRTSRVAEVPQQPPRPRRGHRAGVVVHDHRPVARHPGRAASPPRTRRLGQRVAATAAPAAAASSVSRSTNTAPGMWPRRVVVATRRSAQRPADVEQRRRPAPSSLARRRRLSGAHPGAGRVADQRQVGQPLDRRPVVGVDGAAAERRRPARAPTVSASPSNSGGELGPSPLPTIRRPDSEPVLRDDQRVGVADRVAHRRTGTPSARVAETTFSSSSEPGTWPTLMTTHAARPQVRADRLEELAGDQVERDVRLAVGVEEDRVVAGRAGRQPRSRVGGVEMQVRAAAARSSACRPCSARRRARPRRRGWSGSSGRTRARPCRPRRRGSRSAAARRAARRAAAPGSRPSSRRSGSSTAGTRSGRRRPR